MSRTAAPQRRQAAASTADPWANRIVGHAEVAPADLVANPANWRRHPEAQRRAIRAIFADVGWLTGVIVNRLTGTILDGHMRVDEAVRRGEPTVPITYVELTTDEERRVLAVLDPLGDLAEADSAALGELLASISTANHDLGAFLDDLGRHHAITAPTAVDPDELPSLPDPATTYVRPGQLWRLGAHRVLCGDALDAAAVGRLLAGERPTLLATDPPYGVQLDLARRHALTDRVGAARRGRGHRRVALAGDSRADWSAAYALVPSLEVGYVWHPAVHAGEVIAGLRGIGFEIVSEVIWVKARWVIGPRWYHWAHESCLVVRRRGARARFLGGRNQGTVWEEPSPKVGGSGADPKVDHPSQKPVALFDRPIRNHLPPGGAVYDPFLGSGTTLVAAERSRRRCFGMEIDPVFVQLAIERWQAIAGQRAELIADGDG